MTVKIDIRDGAGLTETVDGYVATRVADITGIGGNDVAKLYRGATRRGVPRIGDQYPAIPNLFCARRVVRPLGNDGVRITFTYERRTADLVDGPVEVEFIQDTIADETVRDTAGNLIQTRYASFGQAGSTLTTKTHRIAVERPALTVRLTQTRSSVPKTLAADLVGRVNAREWSGYAPETWLCRSIASSQIAINRHRVVVTATYRAETWRAEVTTDVDGVIPNDASSENGISAIQVYAAVDFDRLGMSF